ncbi:uncharacterized protein LOC114140258 [Xiphophorus couchianus]|nr:uncharacterized protein LOC114140258 [Xiphophorus couchianus]
MEVKPPGATKADNLDKRGGKKYTQSGLKYGLICYYCQQPGHKASLCPLRKSKSVELCVVPSKEHNYELSDDMIPHKYVVDVVINGKAVKALADTGSSQTLVKSSLLSNVLPNFNKPVNITCVHGCQKEYPTADVTINVEGQAFMLTVGVLNQLAYDVILGEDLPILDSLVQENSVASSCAVTTRSMKKGLEPLPDVDDDLYEVGNKIRKSKRQRRQEKNRNKSRSKHPEPALPLTPCIDFQWKIPNNFKERQENDPSLKPLFNKAYKDGGKESAAEFKSLAGEPFIIRDKLLYLADIDEPRLVVPKEYRSVILHLGHTIPWSGHLGQAKTYNRVAQRFYWPGLYKDVVEYCKTCHDCQLVAPTKVSDRAQLQTLPIMSVPYERIAMDIIGPLPKSSNGYKYALVICDYATRYPDVYPLRSLQVKHIVRCLVDLFSRVGIPKEILTDQGTNFMSQVMKTLYDQLGVKGIRTTPYHPETDGLVERFNGTLKQMLRKFIDDAGKNWDKWLPFLLFAYREVPQASTGFSPFELLYGRQVRGPLDMLKENWVAGVASGSSEAASPTNIISYILQMRDNLEKYREQVKDHMEKAQHKQKVWYDRRARERELKTGQKVLVLLPSGPSKLLAKWQGPYTVVMARIQNAGLTLNVNKCAWAQEEVTYLGYLVGHGQIKPQLEKVRAIQTIPRPQTKKQVRSFLGLVGWYRRFIPHFSTLAAPLTELTKRSTSKIMWKEDCEHAFQSLKKLICQAPVLQSPNFSEPFIVQVDASNVGLGAVLAQGEAGEEKPVLFLSKKLFDREKKYSTVEKEGLAIKWALDSLKYYLLGREFTLQTDHRPLKWMHSKQHQNARILRWCLALQPYQFTIQHCPGKKNLIADYLSRLPEFCKPEGEEVSKC